MSYLHILHEYINGSLRDQLNFREKYSFPFLNDDKNIIYFTKDSTPNFDLKGMLTSNKELVIKLKQTFKDFLLREIEERNITEVKLMIDDKPGKRGIGIIIVQEQVEMVDVNPYVEIISHFDNPSQIDNYCRSNRSIMSICKRKELWRSLVKKVYPFKYKHEYNYEELYKNYLRVRNDEVFMKLLLGYETRPYEITYFKYSHVPELVKFVIFEDMVHERNYSEYLPYIIEDYENNTDAEILLGNIRSKYTSDEYGKMLDTYLGDFLGYFLNAEKDSDFRLVENFMDIDFGPEFGPEWKMDFILNQLNLIDEVPREMIDFITNLLPQKLRMKFKKEVENIGGLNVTDD